MNPSIAKALLLDAVYQVLDNKMFRFLVVLSFLMVLPTFVFGIQEERISILFGLNEIQYDKLWSMFSQGGAASVPDTAHIQVIQVLQGLFVEGLAGTFGILFAVSATSFFLPQMLEKGAADTVFSKPVSRGTLLIARYFSGILFTTILASVMVLGMHLGLTLVSGYSDPGFLWSIPTLIYLFAIVHAFSCCVAVLTRSSVMAILASLIMYAGTGCVHSTWSGIDFFENIEQAQALQMDEAVEEESGGALTILKGALNVLHYTLPKTSDADIIATKLRRSLESEIDAAYVDEELEISIPADPLGFVLQSGGDITGAGVVWTASDADGNEQASITLTRYDRGVIPGVRTKAISSYAARKELQAELKARDDLPARPKLIDNTPVGSSSTKGIRWNEPVAGGLRHREVHFFVYSNWMLEASLDSHDEWYDSEDMDASLDEFLGPIDFPGAGIMQDPRQWHIETYAWSGPLKYNLWFSIGSSLAFILAMLLIAWWKLSRADF